MTNAVTLKTSNGLHILVPVEGMRGRYSVVLSLRRGGRVVVENSTAVFLRLNRG